MKDYKVRNFMQDHPSASFPTFRSLDEMLMKQIREELASKLGLDPSADSLFLINQLAQAQSSLGYDAGSEDFSLKEVITKLGVNPPEYVYINWYRFDDMDRLKLTELSSHFDDIWYSGADDIDILDVSMEWVLSVTHYGDVRFVKLN